MEKKNTEGTPDLRTRLREEIISLTDEQAEMVLKKITEEFPLFVSSGIPQNHDLSGAKSMQYQF